jgi:DHA3 family macrolide efflux protein-like MFS transporter
MLGLIGMGGGVLAIGLAPSWAYWLAVGCMAVVGIMNPICNAPLSALMQARVAPEMQGRVFSLVNAVAAGMAPLGLALAGPVADWLGVRFWFTLAGGVAMLAAVSALFIPVILHIEDNGHQPHAAVIAASAPSPSSD